MSDRDWFTLGVEEEYLLIERHSKALVADPPEGIFGQAPREIGSQVQVTREMMRSQIEVATRNTAASLESARICCMGAGLSPQLRSHSGLRR